MQRPAKPRTPVRFRPQPPLFSSSKHFTCPSGGIGRRKGLKIPRPQGHAGSNPASGTILRWERERLGGGGCSGRYGLAGSFELGVLEQQCCLAETGFGRRFNGVHPAAILRQDLRTVIQ